MIYVIESSFQAYILLDDVYYTICAGLMLMYGTAWAIFGRVDVPVWASFAFTTCIINVALLTSEAMAKSILKSRRENRLTKRKIIHQEMKPQPGCWATTSIGE